MPFLKAGFNGRHFDTGIRGWTRHVEGKRFALAKMIRFEKGDLAWHGARFLAWGEQVVLGSRPEFDLPLEWQHGLPMSTLNIKPKPRPVAAKLELPYPVSANRYWQSFVPKGWTRAVVHPSTEAKSYKSEVGWLAKQAGLREPTTKTVALTFTLCPKKNKDGSANGTVLDLGNCLKVAEDALQGIVYVNDKQVRAIRMGYGEPADGGALIVEIEEFAPAPVGLFALEAAA